MPYNIAPAERASAAAATGRRRPRHTPRGRRRRRRRAPPQSGERGARGAGRFTAAPGDEEREEPVQAERRERGGDAGEDGREAGQQSLGDQQIVGAPWPWLRDDHRTAAARPCDAGTRGATFGGVAPTGMSLGVRAPRRRTCSGAQGRGSGSTRRSAGRPIVLAANRPADSDDREATIDTAPPESAA